MSWFVLKAFAPLQPVATSESTLELPAKLSDVELVEVDNMHGFCTAVEGCRAIEIAGRQ